MTRSATASASSVSCVTHEHGRGEAAEDVLEVGEQRAAGRRVERRHGLVQEHHGRVDGEGARDADALGLAAREAGAPPVGEMLDGEHLEGGVGAAMKLVAVHAPQPQSALHVAAHRGREQVGLLEDRRGAAAQAQPVAAAAHRPAVEDDLAVGLLEPVQGAHQRRLAGAVGAEKHAHLALVEGEALDAGRAWRRRARR